ncbi:DNA replication/repair protein RecF [Algiphilus sp.]|uniref:DNA replication/repair protein RecF n=1 Tax=Algiphilus sp. TaxID=1872431 RepID=UPI003B5162C6
MTYLADCTIRQFRCLSDSRIDLDPSLNWFVGDNGAGKTSVLESLYWLARGKSFRGAPAGRCARSGTSAWNVTARVRHGEAPADRLSLQFEQGGLQARCNDGVTTLVEQARQLPLQMIEPGLHRVVEDGPAYRRRFLDWGMFHVEHSYLDAWRAYARALKQRNAALRSGQASAHLQAWTNELAQSGSRLAQLRRRGVDALQEPFQQRCAALGLEAATLSLLPGWDAEQSLAEALAARAEQDQRQRITTVGPHRSELRISVAGESARDRISRGQQKVLLVALSLAQADVLREAAGIVPVLLMDDFTAELGADFQSRVAWALHEYPGQSIVTSLEHSPAMLGPGGARWFHVEQGRIRRSD